MSDIAKHKRFENDRVVIWEFQLDPGESSGLHTHKRDYFFHIIEGSTQRVTDADGRSLGETTLEPGSTQWVTVDGDHLVMDGQRLPATHEATNIGKTAIREILVEFKS